MLNADCEIFTTIEDKRENIRTANFMTCFVHVNLSNYIKLLPMAGD